MPRDDAATQRDDARKRREKRRELRTAIDAARVNQEELQKPECDDLERAVDAADAMNEGVDKPREMCLDMEHYGQLAAFSLERTKRLGPRGGAATSAKAFLQSLRRRWGEDVRWERLGTGAGKFFREAPAPGFMNGVMDTEIKERRATQRRAREALGPSVAPDEVQDTAAERQTDKMMVAMNKKLKSNLEGRRMSCTGRTTRRAFLSLSKTSSRRRFWSRMVTPASCLRLRAVRRRFRTRRHRRRTQTIVRVSCCTWIWGTGGR